MSYLAGASGCGVNAPVASKQPNVADTVPLPDVCAMTTSPAAVDNCNTPMPTAYESVNGASVPTHVHCSGVNVTDDPSASYVPVDNSALTVPATFAWETANVYVPFAENSTPTLGVPTYSHEPDSGCTSFPEPQAARSTAQIATRHMTPGSGRRVSQVNSEHSFRRAS